MNIAALRASLCLLKDRFNKRSKIGITWGMLIKGAVWADPMTEGYVNVGDQRSSC